MKPSLLVVGLRAEARIVAGPNVRMVIGGGDSLRLAQAIEVALLGGVSSIMSFGLAGGVAPGLRPGAVVIASCVLAGSEKLEADGTWSRDLAGAFSGAVIAAIAGVDRPVHTAVAKRDLHITTGAVTADMESHIAARAANRHKLPFASVRVVADPSDCDLPRAALVAMKPDGKIDATAVLRSVLHNPGQLPALIRTSIHAAAAFDSLRSARHIVGTFLADQSRRGKLEDFASVATSRIFPRSNEMCNACISEFAVVGDPCRRLGVAPDGGVGG